ARRLSGLPAFRFNVPSASSVLRYNRLEGVYAGGGASWVPAPDIRFDATAGYAFGAEAPGTRVQLDYTPGSACLVRAAGYCHVRRDVGGGGGRRGGINPLAAVVGARDHPHRYVADGAGPRARRRLNGAWSAAARVRVEGDDGAPPGGQQP